MEKPKTLTFVDWNGKEKTWIIDPSLNGAAQRTKLSKSLAEKVAKANEHVLKFEKEIKAIPWSR